MMQLTPSVFPALSSLTSAARLSLHDAAARPAAAMGPLKLKLATVDARG
jgi:hypothetical protein